MKIRKESLNKRKQKVQRHRGRKKHGIWEKGKKIKHRVWGRVEGDEDMMAWDQVVNNFEYLAEQPGLYSGGNGEPLEVSEKITDDWAYSFSLVRL